MKNSIFSGFGFSFLLINFLWSAIFLTSCSCKKTVAIDMPVTLTITKIGIGTVTASWEGGSATDEELAHGIKVMPNTQITLSAKTDSANILWAYTNNLAQGSMLPTLIKENTIINVAFYNLSFVNRVVIKKVHGTGIVSASWGASIASDADLTKELTVPKGTWIKITGSSQSPKIIWNGDIQNPRDTIAFFVLKDTVIDVGFYDPTLRVEKVGGGTGTVWGSWNGSTTTEVALLGGIELPLGTQIGLSSSSKYNHTSWIYGRQNAVLDTANSTSFTLTKDTVIKVQFFNMVYVAGYFNNASNVSVAALWKNGRLEILGDGITQSDAESVYVTDNGDIYVAGYVDRKATLWKNGQPTYLSDGYYIGRAIKVYVSDGDVYVSGYDQNKPVIWKNGQPEYLKFHSTASQASALDLCVSKGNVYATGYVLNAYSFLQADTIKQNIGGIITTTINWKNTHTTRAQAVLWVNGEPQYLHEADLSKHGTGYNVYASDNGDVYVAGKLNDTPILWLNGKMQYLENAFGGAAYKVYLLNGNVYVVGISNGESGFYIGGDATVWTNGVRAVYNKDYPKGEAFDMYISTTDWYMTGYIGNKAVLWVNGEPQYLSSGGISSYAKRLFVN